MSNFKSSNCTPKNKANTFFVQSNSSIPPDSVKGFAPWLHVLLELLKPNVLNAPGLPENERTNNEQTENFKPREFQ